MIRTRTMLGALFLIAVGSLAAPVLAADSGPPAPAGEAAAAGPATPSAPGVAEPAPGSSASSSLAPTGDAGDSSAASAGVPMVAASTQAAPAARYGLGARFRVTSVPKWMLGLFLDESVPLTSYTTGLEFFRRSGNFDLVIGVAYQNLSPKDGNWLGSGNDPSTETDFIQFRNLASWSADAAFILHTEFNEYVGMHYGGGVGIGIFTGKMLRTSAGSPGCQADAGSVVNCHPIVCATGPCTDGQLKSTEGGTDSPGSPSRFSDNHVPTVYPIVNLITGLDVRLPSVPGLAFKLDLGYFLPYFFVGAGVAYQI
jgi:hypothetical protein